MMILALAVMVILGTVALSTSPVEAKGGWIACPSPPCAAPCVLGGEPTVLCKSRGSAPQATTYACCCCGGSGNRYKPL